MTDRDNAYNPFDRLDVEEYASTPERVNRIYQAAMAKAGLPVPKAYPRRSLLLAAAVVSAGLLTAAASFLSASDLFRGHLTESAGPDATAPLSALSPIVDRTGTVLDVQPSTDRGICITPRAVAGDDRSFVVLFEVERTDGAPLGVEQADGTLSDRDMYFLGASLTRQDGQGVQVFTEGMASTVNGNTATVLQRFDLYEAVPQGETIHVAFRNLWQKAVLPGEAVGLDGDDLLGMLLDDPADSDFVSLDSIPVSGHYSAGAGYDVLALVKDTGGPVSLGGPLDGYAVTGAAVHDGWLYLRGTSPQGRYPFRDMMSAAMVGGGMEIPVASAHYADDDVNPPVWGLAFAGVDSVDQLRDLALVINYGETSYLVVEGDWSFDIPIEYAHVTREFTPNKPMELNGVPGTLTAVTVSPYRVVFDFLPGAAGMAEQVLDDPYSAIALELADGVRVFPALQGVETVDNNGLIRWYSHLNDIIDPDKVTALIHWDREYPLE